MADTERTIGTGGELRGLQPPDQGTNVHVPHFADAINLPLDESTSSLLQYIESQRPNRSKIVQIKPSRRSKSNW